MQHCGGVVSARSVEQVSSAHTNDNAVSARCVEEPASASLGRYWWVLGVWRSWRKWRLTLYRFLYMFKGATRFLHLRKEWFKSKVLEFNQNPKMSGSQAEINPSSLVFLSMDHFGPNKQIACGLWTKSFLLCVLFDARTIFDQTNKLHVAFELNYRS